MSALFARLCIVACSLLAAIPLHAQQSVRVAGRAFDETLHSSVGIGSVQVVLVSAADTTVRVKVTSDRDGQFLIDGLAPGRYQVRMSRIGYNWMRWERTFDRAEDTLNVGMRPSNSADYVCPTDTVLEPHFLVMVRDQDVQPVTSGITIIARSGTGVDTLRKSDDAYSATPKREGMYVLEVTGPGFRPMQSGPVNVQKVVNRPNALCGIPIPSVLFIERTGARARSLDSARIEAGRIVVEPVGISFDIPRGWESRVTRSAGPTCNLKSAQARSVNVDPSALRSLTGPSSYFGDQYYSAFADSIFDASELVAHLGALGWRDCDNTVSDLQMRVYVTDRSARAIAERFPRIRLSPYPGYSAPTIAAARDSADWHINEANWTFNCGDCVGPERFEVYSTAVGARTVSLVFMYSPVYRNGYEKNPQRIADLRSILESFRRSARPRN